MAKIIKVYKENISSVMLVGKVYHNEDRNEYGTFSTKWEKWFNNNLFQALSGEVEMYDNSYVGAMRMNGNVFEYWIGVLAKSTSSVPKDFAQAEIKGGDYAVAWIQGEDNAELYSMHEKCMESFIKEGFKIAKDAWYIERYVCPRFTRADENNEVILDYVVTLESHE